MVPNDVRTLADFVKWCAANPKQASYGTAAAGSMLHFTGVTLAGPASSNSCICPMAARAASKI